MRTPEVRDRIKNGRPSRRVPELVKKIRAGQPFTKEYALVKRLLEEDLEANYDQPTLTNDNATDARRSLLQLYNALLTKRFGRNTRPRDRALETQRRLTQKSREEQARWPLYVLEVKKAIGPHATRERVHRELRKIHDESDPLFVAWDPKTQPFTPIYRTGKDAADILLDYSWPLIAQLRTATAIRNHFGLSRRSGKLAK